MDRIGSDITVNLSAAVTLLPASTAAAHARLGVDWWHVEARRMRSRADLIEQKGGSPLAQERLASDIAKLERQRGELAGSFPFLQWLASWFPPARGAAENLNQSLDSVDSKIRQRHVWTDRTLLEYDGSGDGHIVEVIGDLTTAENIVVLIPGVGTDLSNYEAVLRRDAQNLADHLEGSESAVITWLGYDPPDSVLTAVSAGPAKEGALRLAEFLAALPPAHTTVVGHSYGSLVAGLSARDVGIAVDELVFIGSPGVGTDNVEELELPSSTTVWAAISPKDPIRLARPHCLTAPDRCLSDPEVLFGVAPTDPSFGASTFAAGDAPFWAAHSSYYDRGSTSLDNLAKIVKGDA